MLKTIQHNNSLIYTTSELFFAFIILLIQTLAYVK